MFLLNNFREFLTFRHELLVLNNAFQRHVDWQLRRIKHGRLDSGKHAASANSIEIVSQCQTVARFDLKYLMFTVTVECGPRYLILVATPVISHLLALVSDLELSALVLKWEADN